MRHGLSRPGLFSFALAIGVLLPAVVTAEEWHYSSQSSGSLGGGWALAVLAIFGLALVLGIFSLVKLVIRGLAFGTRRLGGVDRTSAPSAPGPLDRGYVPSPAAAPNGSQHRLESVAQGLSSAAGTRDAPSHDERPIGPVPAGVLSFVETQDYEKGFAGYFAQHVAPLLAQLEDERHLRLRWLIWPLIAGAGLIVLIAYAGSALPPAPHSQGRLSPVLIFIVLFAMAGWTLLSFAQYRDRSRSVLLRPVVRFFGTLDCPDARFDLDRLKPFRIVPNYEKCSTGAYISGTLDEIGIDIAELDMWRGTGKSRHTLFAGVALLVEMRKPCAGETVVNSRTWARAFSFSQAGLEPVELEDPGFQQLFTVHSSDQVEARYLLTTAFMERLKELSALVRQWRPGFVIGAPRDQAVGRPLHCDFLGGHALFMIDMAVDVFESGNLFRTALNVDDIRRLLYQIFLLRRIIEVLKLNQHGPPAT